MLLPTCTFLHVRPDHRLPLSNRIPLLLGDEAQILILDAFNIFFRILTRHTLTRVWILQIHALVPYPPSAIQLVMNYSCAARRMTQNRTYLPLRASRNLSLPFFTRAARTRNTFQIQFSRYLYWAFTESIFIKNSTHDFRFSRTYLLMSFVELSVSSKFWIRHIPIRSTACTPFFQDVGFGPSTCLMGNFLQLRFRNTTHDRDHKVCLFSRGVCMNFNPMKFQPPIQSSDFRNIPAKAINRFDNYNIKLS
ncbi:hypothetical protein A0U93_11665 [Neoasaia chiangmaiensis]|uniref:Uncharacterized protein n=1 Tax=Neoasaia chiangmaiensis TaxID=320497 RepID=A0A1U9KRV1_9PROT|nr:hypothetical protein A0U93_11665 [Neoasaia chiangmaiensis]